MPAPTRCRRTSARLDSSVIVDVRVRYKQGRAGESQLLRRAYGEDARRQHPSLKFVFAAGVSEFAAFLRGSQYMPPGELRAIIERIRQAEVIDAEGAVREMRELVEHTRSLRR